MERSFRGRGPRVECVVLDTTVPVFMISQVASPVECSSYHLSTVFMI